MKLDLLVATDEHHDEDEGEAHDNKGVSEGRTDHDGGDK